MLVNQIELGTFKLQPWEAGKNTWTVHTLDNQQVKREVTEHMQSCLTLCILYLY